MQLTLNLNIDKKITPRRFERLCFLKYTLYNIYINVIKNLFKKSFFLCLTWFPLVRDITYRLFIKLL